MPRACLGCAVRGSAWVLALAQLEMPLSGPHGSGACAGLGPAWVWALPGSGLPGSGLPGSGLPVLALRDDVGMICFQVEADLGYPGGKAKIIHKESDIIMAFAINRVRLGGIYTHTEKPPTIGLR